jgi:hypothetical protein
MTIAEEIFYSVIAICALPIVLFFLFLLTIVAFAVWTWVDSKMR